MACHGVVAGFGPEQVCALLGHAAPLELSGYHGRRIDDHLVGARGLTEKASTLGRVDVIRAVANLAATGTAFKQWLAARPYTWRDGIEVVAMDGLSGFKTATTDELSTQSRSWTRFMSRGSAAKRSTTAGGRVATCPPDTVPRLGVRCTAGVGERAATFGRPRLVAVREIGSETAR